MKGVKIFLGLQKRAPENDLLATLGEETVGVVDRILLNNNIELLLQAGAEGMTIVGQESQLDELFLTPELEGKIHFIQPSEGASIAETVFEKFYHTEDKYFILRGNTFGFDPAYYAILRNQLEIDEDVCVLHSAGETACAAGLLRLEPAAVHFFEAPVTKGQYVFGPDAPDKYFLFSEGYCLVESHADFKELYYRLSHRENMHLCSKYFYDQFTEIFIEFKELLK